MEIAQTVQLLKNKFFAGLATGLTAILLSLSLSNVAFAQDSSAAPPQKPDIQASTCQGAELAFPKGQAKSNACSFTGSSPESKINQLVATVVNLFSVLVGVVAVIMIIVGGFRYITSGGDSGNVSSAKNTILYAIVGLVIVALSQFIVKFVLAKATSTTTT